jgi:hypothetical protein
MDNELNIKVLLSIRRQDTWLASRFAEDSSKRFQVSNNDFQNYINSVLNMVKNGEAEGLDYYNLNKMLVDLFGKQNVKILLYEDLQCMLNDYIFDICELGVFDSNMLQDKLRYKLNTASINSNTWKGKQYVPNFLSSKSILGTLLRKSSLYPFIKNKFSRRKLSIILDNETQKQILKAFYSSNYNLDTYLDGKLLSQHYY